MGHALQLCAEPRCPALVPRGRCATHERPRQADHRESAHRRGYGWAWRKLRAEVLRAEPWCRACAAEGLQVPATDVDHIVPLAQGGTNERGNLQPLCHQHHSAKTCRTDGGFGR